MLRFNNQRCCVPTSDKVVTASNFRFWPKKRNAQIKAHRLAMTPRGLQGVEKKPTPSGRMCTRICAFSVCEVSDRGGSGGDNKSNLPGGTLLWRVFGFMGVCVMFVFKSVIFAMSLFDGWPFRSLSILNIRYWKMKGLHFCWFKKIFDSLCKILVPM